MIRVPGRKTLRRTFRFSVKVLGNSIPIAVLLVGSMGGLDIFLGVDSGLGAREAEAVYTGKQLRTVEFVLGGGGGISATQTGTDNNGVARASDANVYAGNEWNATKATAGTKSIVIPGSGIRVLSAYVDITSTLVNTVDITDLEVALDVSPGPAGGEDIPLSPVTRNGTTLLFTDNSGLSSPILSAKVDATSLFQTQTDGNWNSGLAVVGMLSVTGPTWHLATMKLVITYEQNYSTSAHTELKTVRFPLRSTAAGDSGTKRADCTVGTCSFSYTLNLPDLATTSDIMDAWFDISYVEDGANNITPSINGGDAGTVHNPLENSADGMERFLVYRPRAGAPNLATSTQTLDIATAGTIGGLGGEVVITYKFSTGAITQVETVQYFMGQQATLPGTASSSFLLTPTISNGGASPRSLWFRIHDSVTNTPSLAIATKIGASATTTITYTPTLANPRGGELRIIQDIGVATTSWSGSATTLSFDARHNAATYDGPPGVEVLITFYWSGSGGGTVTKTGKFFAGTSGAVAGLANTDSVFPFPVTLPETVTKTYRSSYLTSSVLHTDATSIIPGTVKISLAESGAVTVSEGTEDVESFRAIYLKKATSTNFTDNTTIPWTTQEFSAIIRGNQTEEYAVNNELVVTYDANLGEEDPEVTEGKQIRTVEYTLGSGAGTGATQTGTDNPGTARNSDDNVYAGTSWNTTKGTAGAKTIQLAGSGIRVISAYLDTTASLVSATDVTDLELALDVSPGLSAGTDVSVDTNARNGTGLIIADNSGVSSPLFSAKADVTALFQTQTDSEWNTGLSVTGMMSITGPTWHLATMKLIVTYEENFTLVPHYGTKTVRFPLRSTTAGDSGTKRADCAIGATCSFSYTAELPDLSSTADIEDVWFEISLNETGAANITPSINGGSAGTTHAALEALGDTMERFLIYRPAIGGGNFATSTQQLDIVDGVSAIGALGGEVVVTYKYSTGATTQVETVQYFMGQQTTLPGTASSSFLQTAVIVNGSAMPRHIWYRIHDSVANTPRLTIAGKIGASATTTTAYTPTYTGARGGELRIVHDLGSATTSWTGTSSVLSIDVRHEAATYDASAGVEAFITFQWAGGLNGPVTKTARYFSGYSGSVPALANSDTSESFAVVFPETVLKTLRSSYLSTSVMHTDATSIIPGTVRITLSGRAPVVISEATEDAENFRAIYLTEATSTDFLPGSTIPFSGRGFNTIVRGNQTEEYAMASEMVVTYDANLTLKTPVLAQNVFRFYVDNNLLLPTDPWPSGAVNLSEGSPITAPDIPPGSGDRVRLRLSFSVSTTTLTASSTAFKLQYGAPTSTCANLGATWSDVGVIGSGAIWRGFNTAVTDETNLSGDPYTLGDLVLSASDRAGSFEEGNNSKANPFAVFVNEDTEYDWVLEDNGAATNTDYCFRMVYVDGTPFSSYGVTPPMIRTAGYAGETRNWKWYDDENNETPTAPLANQNVAPANIKFGDKMKLRITVADTRGHYGVNQKFRLQFSDTSDFSSGVNFVGSTTSCTVYWCYANGVDNDDDPVTALLLTDSSAVGRHNEAPTTTSTFRPVASTAHEMEFTITHAGAAPNTTYFFRLYDVNNNYPVPKAGTASYPSVATGDTTLTFEVDGVPSASSTLEGVTTDIATTPYGVPFGSLDVGVPVIGAHWLRVVTNAGNGYQVFVSETQNFLSAGGGEIPGVNASNTLPLSWGVACAATSTGCFGYHTGDDTLFGGSGRFSANDTWAEFEIPAREIMYSGAPTTATDTTTMIFKVERHGLLPAGAYETAIQYIVVPVF